MLLTIHFLYELLRHSTHIEVHPFVTGLTRIVMSRTSEGVMISSLQKEIGQLQEALSYLHPLPKLARQQFINDINISIGSLEDPHMPLGLKPTLMKLLNACPEYFEEGNERSFIALCKEAIDLCGQGWCHLNYWVCSEQNLCYSIFWSLQVALENHQKQISMYTSPQNDAGQRPQLLKMPTFEAR